MADKATNCSDCYKAFSLATGVINVAGSYDLPSNNGICSMCIVKEREWECRPCSEKITFKMGFSRPKCSKCGNKMNPVTVNFEEAKLQRDEINVKANAMIITTSGNIEGKSITSYKGLVIGSAISRGRNPTDDISSNSLLEQAGELWVDSMMAKSMQTYLEKATKDAEYQIKLAAIKLGANAVIGIDIDFVGSKIMQVHMNGTAVVIE